MIFIKRLVQLFLLSPVLVLLYLNWQLSYGAFYKGWTSYLAGRYLELTPFEERDTLIVNSFKSNCSEIKKSY